jgi:transposase-like protein
MGMEEAKQEPSIGKHPVGGVDYPRTLSEFDKWFASEAACIEFMVRVRWPEGFVCPGCGARAAWRTARDEFRCSQCQRQTSVTAGTILEGTRKPLRIWFQTMWYVTSQKQGVSALGLQRVLGLGSYQTAWAWLHKLRRAMVRPGRDRLAAEVEVDETYVGGAETGVVGRMTLTKSIVVIAAEVRGRATGRIRMACVPDLSGESLVPFVAATVCEGAVVHTDGWRSYNGLAQLGYDHRPTNLSAVGDPAHVVMPRVHRIASLLDRWWLGTHQGAIRAQHLDYYLDEFTFRFNRRTAQARGLLFYRLLQQALNVDPMPYKVLRGGKRNESHNI